jgi:hypothetical protein
MKIRPAGAELFHAERRTDGQTDGQTDRHDEANSRFSQFCERAYKRDSQKLSLTLRAGGVRELSDEKLHEVVLQDRGLSEISLRVHKVYNV